MAINFQHTDGNGLFDIQGRAFNALSTLDTARGTTVPADVEAILVALNRVASIPISYENAARDLPQSLTTWQSNGNSLVSAIQSFTQSILAAFIAEDASLVDTSITAALEYLIEQMEAGSFYVTPNVVAGTLTAGAANVGDTTLAWTLKRGDGRNQENAYAETITLTVTSANGSTPTIACVGEAAAPVLGQSWPDGSGVSKSITATDPDSSLLSNGNFAAATIANVPDYWVVTVGVPGTSVVLTSPEVQTVAIGGTPTGGSYVLLYTDRDGHVWSTASLAYNASASAVQSALRTIADLADVTVSATGTTPNFTHSITFTGVGGNVAQLTSVDNMTGGTHSITHGTTTAGDAGDFRGVALKLVGDSSTLQTLYHPLAVLRADTVYFAHLRAKRSGAATGSVLKVAIVQEIGGTALADDEGNANELTIDGSALSDSDHESQWFSFRLPASVLSPVYLRLAVTTAIPTGSSIYVDDVAVAAGSELYNGGPIVAAFSGRTAAQIDDYWTLAVTNSRAGVWQTAYNRAFAMADKGLLLPSSGLSKISDNFEQYPA